MSDPDNLFFDLRSLRALGKGSIIGKTARIRYPELVSIGENCIIDDFTYISTQLELTGHVHIASGCKVIGGREARVRLDEFSTLAPNVVLAAGSDDYVAGIAGPTVPREFKGNCQTGAIRLGRHCIIGTGSVVLPDVECEEGSAVGALSLVNRSLTAWTLFAGVPATKIGDRDRLEVKRLEALYQASRS